MQEIRPTSSGLALFTRVLRFVIELDSLAGH